jgi:hypothetical protein
MLASIASIPSFIKILSNAPRYHSTHPFTTPNIIRNKTQQLGGCAKHLVEGVCHLLARRLGGPELLLLN